MTDHEKSLLLDHLSKCNAYLIRRKAIKKPSRGAIMRVAKAKLMLESNCTCFWCGKRCRVVKRCQNDPDFATIEHFVPSCLGGKNTASNFRLSCLSCNSRRGGILSREMQLKYTPGLWDII